MKRDTSNEPASRFELQSELLLPNGLRRLTREQTDAYHREYVPNCQYESMIESLYATDVPFALGLCYTCKFVHRVIEPECPTCAYMMPSQDSGALFGSVMSFKETIGWADIQTAREEWVDLLAEYWMTCYSNASEFLCAVMKQAVLDSVPGFEFPPEPGPKEDNGHKAAA